MNQTMAVSNKNILRAGGKTSPAFKKVFEILVVQYIKKGGVRVW
jgi:hypothetical protein